MANWRSLSLTSAGNVRDHLNVPAEIVAVAFLIENGAEDLAARGKIRLAQS